MAPLCCGSPAAAASSGPRRGARSSVAPLTFATIGPPSGRVSVPCADVRPSTSRSMVNSDSRPALKSPRPRRTTPSPSSWTASMPVSRSWSSSTRADALAAASRGLRHSSAATASSAPVRSAVTARSPWPLRRSFSTNCSCAGPFISDVASRPTAASCRASGWAATVMLCTTCVAGPARKSIATSSFAGMEASCARPPSFMPRGWRSDRTCPGRDRGRRPPHRDAPPRGAPAPGWRCRPCAPCPPAAASD